VSVDLSIFLTGLLSISALSCSSANFQVNISLIVNDDEAEKCVKALHYAFFESGDLLELHLCGATSGNGSAVHLDN